MEDPLMGCEHIFKFKCSGRALNMGFHQGEVLYFISGHLLTCDLYLRKTGCLYFAYMFPILLRSHFRFRKYQRWKS